MVVIFANTLTIKFVKVCHGRKLFIQIIEVRFQCSILHESHAELSDVNANYSKRVPVITCRMVLVTLEYATRCTSQDGNSSIHNIYIYAMQRDDNANKRNFIILEQNRGNRKKKVQYFLRTFFNIWSHYCGYMLLYFKVHSLSGSHYPMHLNVK